MTETPPTETDNLVLVVPDALRAGYWPDLPGSTTDALAGGPYTPACFPTLVSGRSRDEHGIQWFVDDPTSVPVVYDLEQRGYDVAYWDAPEDPVRNITRAPAMKPLEAMEPPFVWVARLLWTHTPYGYQWDVDESEQANLHNPGAARAYDGIDGGDTGHDYIDMMRDGEVDFQEDYQTGVEKTRERILSWRDTLADRGMMDDTTFIVQADHGDAWGGPFGVDDCGHYLHTDTNCNHVMEIKCTVLGRDIDLPNPLLQRNTLALWDESWRGGRNDLDTIARSGNEVTDEARDRLSDLGYL